MKMVRAGTVICYHVAAETQGAAMGNDDVHTLFTYAKMSFYNKGEDGD